MPSRKLMRKSQPRLQSLRKVAYNLLACLHIKLGSYNSLDKLKKVRLEFTSRVNEGMRFTRWRNERVFARALESWAERGAKILFRNSLKRYGKTKRRAFNKTALLVQTIEQIGWSNDAANKQQLKVVYAASQSGKTHAPLPPKNTHIKHETTHTHRV